MGATLAVAALWLLFASTHMAFSSLRLRPALVARLGERGFAGAYSLVALAIFVSLCSVYASHKHGGPFLWYLGAVPAVRFSVYAGMALALALLVSGVITPSPAATLPGRPEPRGLLRVTRHPVLMALGLYGLLHLLVARVHAVDLVFFAGFPLFVAVGARHQDQRKLATLGEDFRRFHAETSFLPFGRAGFARGLREAWPAAAIGVGLTWLLRTFHPSWFGGA